MNLYSIYHDPSGNVWYFISENDYINIEAISPAVFNNKDFRDYFEEFYDSYQFHQDCHLEKIEPWII